ncbi:prefoldin subunit [Desulfurobacterium atlanticum]|uniref:Prefoldin subunit n=1 Tax=Desulfurobacterium atlanticum TaxID=240169 RepID=A0A238Y8X6_9BACT|nr:prefoldin subunit [Desulfurobacterium atlanticum]SNR67034.1 Prefoldin subunit [Desulfurobacterium atlanticum]
MKEKKNKEKERVLKFLEKLPPDRKIYYRIGTVMVEVTREEAIRLLEKEEN